MLSPEQIEKRKDKLTASRVAVLMTGDAEGIMRLYLEMIGEQQPEDLSAVWPVQLGIATEQVNLDWFERKQKVAVTRRGEVVIHCDYSWAACTIDGWVQQGFVGYPIECKHVGGREPLEVIIERYFPQCLWQMACTSAKQCALSVIVGANEPVVEYIDRDDPYIEEMVKRGKKFMTCVAARLVPVTLPAVPPPVPHDAMIELDMTADSTWKKHAGIYLQSYQAAASAKEFEKIIKSLVGENVRKAFGWGIRVTRDKANRLSLREEKNV